MPCEYLDDWEVEELVLDNVEEVWLVDQSVNCWFLGSEVLRQGIN